MFRQRGICILGELEQSKRWEIAWKGQDCDSPGQGDPWKMGGALDVACAVSAGFGGENALGGLVCIRGQCPEPK